MDLALELEALAAGSLVMREGHAVVETKTEDGSGRMDKLMAEHGLEPVGFSKLPLRRGHPAGARDGRRLRRVGAAAV